MSRWLAVLAMVGGLAGAARAGTIAPPAGWTADRDQAGRMTVPTRLAGAPARVELEVYHPATPGAVLYVTRTEAAVAADRRAAVASAELGELTAAMHRQGAGVIAESSSQRANPAARQLEAAARWRDEPAGLIASSRMVIAADAARLVVVRAECMLAVDTPTPLAAACEDALATLDPQIAVEQRVALAIVATPAASPEVGPLGSTRGAPATKPARLDDASRAVLPPIPVAAQHRTPDRRPIYLGGGLIVLAVVFYLNRRRRERFEADEAPAPPTSDGSSGDGDADDLHAAASEPTEDDR